MPLTVLPVQLKDFDTLLERAHLTPPGDDLVAPPLMFFWTVQTREDANARLEMHIAKIRNRFLYDETAQFVKVVETENETTDPEELINADIIALARWHYYPNGYSYKEMAKWERAEMAPGREAEGWHPSFNRELHDYVLDYRDSLRASWIGTPAWILMGLVTRASKRGLGAAGLILDWGVKLSEETGVPAYLESAPLAQPLYRRHGFKALGKPLLLDLRPIGMDSVTEVACMARIPSTLREGAAPPVGTAQNEEATQ